jgi:hypothetical protein
VILAVLAVACTGSLGSQPAKPVSTATSGSPAATATPTAVAQELLYVVIEPGHEPVGVNDSVVIVRPDGTAQARAQFTPRTPPLIGNAAAIMAPEAYVAAGKVFFMDGKGALRSLDRQGQVSPVASFPLGPQQQIAFAVSPDGRHVLADVLTYPPAHFPRDIQQPFDPGTFKQDLYAADAGGPTRTVFHRDEGNTLPSDVIEPVAWDAQGPIATIDSSLGTQQGIPRRWFGHAARIDANGGAGPVLGGADCFAQALLGDGTVLCGDDRFQAGSVRSPSGGVLYPLPGGSYLTLAPDGSAATASGFSGDAAVLVRKDGSTAQLPPGIYAEGWLDPQTIIGISDLNTNRMEVVRLSALSKIEDLGYGGWFVGVLT